MQIVRNVKVCWGDGGGGGVGGEQNMKNISKYCLLKMLTQHAKL